MAAVHLAECLPYELLLTKVHAHPRVPQDVVIIRGGNHCRTHGPTARSDFLAVPSPTEHITDASRRDRRDSFAPVGRRLSDAQARTFGLRRRGTSGLSAPRARLMVRDPILDYYAILGVHPTAEDIVIRAAYKALAQRYHPDRFAGSKDEAHRRMSDLTKAYEVLADPVRRPKYDRRRSLTRSRSRQASTARRNTRHPRSTPRSSLGRREAGEVPRGVVGVDDRGGRPVRRSTSSTIRRGSRDGWASMPTVDPYGHARAATGAPVAAPLVRYPTTAANASAAKPELPISQGVPRLGIGCAKSLRRRPGSDPAAATGRRWRTGQETPGATTGRRRSRPAAAPATAR